MDEFVDKVLISIKDELLNGIDSKYHEELLVSYKKHLMETLKNIKLTQDNLDHFLKIEIDDNLSVLKKYSPDLKLQLFINDENYNFLHILSFKGYNYALDNLLNNKTISIDVANKNIKEMKDLIIKVFDFNMVSAAILLSDGILDYNYACGLSKDMSFRLSHNVINDKDNEEIKK